MGGLEGADELVEADDPQPASTPSVIAAAAVAPARDKDQG
jgi:hypothetical protein